MTKSMTALTHYSKVYTPFTLARRKGRYTICMHETLAIDSVHIRM